jgi:hypothetical protein
MGEPIIEAEPVVLVGLSQVASEALVAELRRRGGFRIQEDDGMGWVSPGAASRAVGYHRHWLSKILRKGVKPPGLEMEYAKSGSGRRLLHVRISSEFRNWAEARREPQRSLL